MEQTTWFIWRALHTPITAIGQQLHEMRDTPLPRFQVKKYYIALFFLLMGLIMLMLVSGDGLAVILSGGLIIMLTLVVMLILASGTIHGARWAFQIATIVYQDIHDGRYELMSLSPLGVLGTLWMMTHQQTRINRVIAFFQTVSLALFLAMVVVGMFFIFTLLQGPPTIFLSQPILGSILMIGLVILIFYLDYVQAVVIGHLSGIYFASVGTTLMTAELMAMACVIAIQLGTYMMSALAASLGAIMATYIFSQTSEASLLLIALIFVGTVYIFREVTIRILWRTILMRFAVTNIEFAKFRQGVHVT